MQSHQQLSGRSESKLTKLIKQLALSFFAVSLGFLIIIAVMLWNFAQNVDEAKIQQSHKATANQLHLIGQALAARVKDYSWWTPALENVVIKKDTAWITLNYGEYLQDNFFIDEVLVVAGNNKPTYAERSAQEVSAQEYLGFNYSDLLPMIEKAQNTPIDTPEAFYSYIERNGQLYWIAYCAMTSEEPEDALSEGSRRPVQFFVRSFENAKASIEEENTLHHLSWFYGEELHAVKSDHDRSVALTISNLNHSVLGSISWGLNLPGQTMLADSLLWSSPLLLLSVLLAFFIQRRFKSTFAKAESISLNAALIKSSQEFFQTMADDAPVLIWETDPKGRIIYTNKRFSDLLGVSADAEASISVFDLVESEDVEMMQAFFKNCMVNKVSKGHEFKITSYQGDEYWLFIVCSPQRELENSEQRYIFSANDVTERKAMEEEAWYQANYDDLTQLPNRSLFQNRLVQGIKNADRNNTNCALMFIDLDNFKNINDSLGHGAGDYVLQEAAGRLSKSIRDTDTAARLGGDEFVLLLVAEKGSSEFDKIARRVLKELARPFELEHTEVSLSGSIGIAIYPDDGHSDEVLMMNADTAMYHAKREGRNQISYYAPEMNAQLKASMQIEADLRKGLEQEELFLVYQPIISLDDNTLIGVESLVRWRKANGDMVYPDEFIYIAEQSGLIASLGDYVLEKSCAQLKAWQDQGYDISISVNVSPLQLFEEGFSKRVKDLLDEYQIAPEKLQLELTEQIFIEDSKEMVEALDEIRGWGVNLAIDDFGTGYSSLSYLQKLAVNVLKIDRSFMDRIPLVSEHVKLVRAIIAMAHSLNLSVVAEGVEQEEQHVFLRAEGCDKSQGYYYSRPVDAEAIVKMLQQ